MANDFGNAMQASALGNHEPTQIADDVLNAPYYEPAGEFREVRGVTIIIAFMLGMAIIAAAIMLGRSYVFYFIVLVLSLLLTILWRQAPRPWIFLVSIAAATPMLLFRQNFACNLIFAFWLIVFNVRYLLQLPKWIYAPIGLAFLGLLTSSPNWMSSNVTGSLMRQGAYAYNFILAPMILLPVIYFRMGKSRDTTLNLQGLLFYLIVPSTAILVAAKLFGTIANAWEASQHAQSLAEGFLQYKLGRVVVNFQRTEVGFILAALICASAAITISQVKTSYRLLAGACLASNVFLLLATGSFGSAFACLCGLAAIFYRQFRSGSAGKVLVSVAVILSMLLFTFLLAPPSMKAYLEKRYEHRVTNADQDRVGLWARAIDYVLEHPEGMGLTFTVGEKVKTNPHNDYLFYAVSYGVIGGVAYTYLVIGMLISFLRSNRITPGDQYALALQLAGLSVIIAVAVNSMTDHMAASRWYFNVIWSVIWYCYFCSRAVQTVSAKEGIASEALTSERTTHHKWASEVHV